MIIMEEIYSVFDQSEVISVYDGGVKTSYSSGSDGYGKILNGWNDMIAGSHQMPAFGVSINDLTVKEMQTGKWVEFEFGKKLTCCGMPFEKLLVAVNKDYYGFNLIRYESERGYDGRCFYLDLVGKNMGEFYDLLCNL